MANKSSDGKVPRRVSKRRHSAGESEALPPNLETLRAAKPIVPRLFNQFPSRKRKRRSLKKD